MTTAWVDLKRIAVVNMITARPALQLIDSLFCLQIKIPKSQQKSVIYGFNKPKSVALYRLR